MKHKLPFKILLVVAMLFSIMAKADQLNGSYTIDPGSPASTTNFQDFASAITYMTSTDPRPDGGDANTGTVGVSGPVVFQVAAGTYSVTDQILIPEIPGASVDNTITFDGSDATTAIITGSISGAVLVFNECKYVTVKNLSIINTSTRSGGGVVFYNTQEPSVDTDPAPPGSCNTISGCIVNVSYRRGGVCIGIVSDQSGTSIWNNCYADSITIDNNICSGGMNGIGMEGTWPNNFVYNRGIKVTNNTISDFGDAGIAFESVLNETHIEHNKINGGGTSIQVYAYYYNPTDRSYKIIGNTCTGFSNTGIYCDNIFGTITNPVQIYNNICVPSPSGRSYQTVTIYTDWGNSSYTEILHNTFVKTGTENYSLDASALYYGGDATNAIVKNNEFVNLSGGQATAMFLDVSSIPANAANYNNYYSNGVNLMGKSWTPYTSSTYKTTTAGGDSSYNEMPSFINLAAGNVHLTDGCGPKGIYFASVSVDIDGDVRPSPPTVGADEAIGQPNDISVKAILSPVIPITLGLQDMTVLVKNVGTNTLTNFDISYIKNNGAPVTINWTGTLAPCSETVVTFTGANQINLGAANSIVVFTSGPNSNVDANRSNDSARTILYAPLSGGYVIGHSPAANFNSFTEALTALSSGIAGPVNFTVEAGDYEETVQLDAPVGLSSTNTITFDGGNAATTSITSYDASAFVINQCSYVTLKNLTINNLGGSFVLSIVGNMSDNKGSACTVKQCVINCFGDQYGYGISISGSANSPWNSCHIDSTLIDSCQINGGGNGIMLTGDTYNNGTFNIENRFTNNQVNNGTQTGIQVQAGGGTTIAGNKVIMDDNTSYTTGISLNAGTYMSVGSMYFTKGPKTVNAVNANYVVASNQGISVNNPGGTTNRPSMICNNMVYVDGPSPYVAMNVNGNQSYLNSGDPTPTCRIYHNTVNLNTSSMWAQAAFYYNYSSYTNPAANDLKADIKNNIFTITSAGPSTVPAYVYVYSTGGVAPTPTMDYNIYYNKTGPYLLNIGGANYNSTNYNLVTTGGPNSFNVAPAFINGANMHITNACHKGVDLTAWVPKDIDGEVRSTTPNIGADEYPGLSLDVSVEAVTAPTFPIQAGLNDLSVRVRNNGYSILNSFSLSYSLNGDAPVTLGWTGTFNPCDTMTITFTGEEQIDIPEGSNNLVVFSSNPNASADMNPTNDMINVALSTPMEGDFVIGDQPGDDYANFTQAVTDLEVRGVKGNVNLKVRAGNYYENVFMESITGTSETSTITFSSMDGDVNSVNVEASSDYVLTLKNISYTTFENITFNQTSSDYDMGGVNCIGVLNNNTITGCKIIVPYYNGYLINSNADNYNFVITHNEFQGSGSGIQHYSNTTNTPSDFSSFIIDSNIFISNSNGIGLNYIKDTKIRGNYNNIDENASGGGIYTYYAQSLNTAFEVTNNTWEITSSSGYNNFNWAFDYCNSYLNSPSSDLYANISYNTINLVNADYLYAYGSCYYGKYINYHHNNQTLADNGSNSQFSMQWYSVNNFNAYNNAMPTGYGNFYYYGAFGSTGNKFVNNTLTSAYGYPWSSAIYFDGISSDFIFRNNLIAYMGTSGSSFTAYVPTGVVWDYNVYYDYYQNGTINGYSDLPSWKAASGVDVNSLTYDPGIFNMTSDLRPDPDNQNAWALNGRGMPDSTITDDVIGNPRSSQLATGASDVGAYEFTPNTVPPVADAYPSDPAQGITQVFMFGQDSIATITWDQFATVPSAVTVQLYSGTNPPAVLGGNMLNAYWDIQSPDAGTYSYALNLYHKGNMVGNNPDKSTLIGAQRDGSWNFIYASTSDVVNNIITIPGLTTFGQFTGTDENSPFTGLTPPIFFGLHAKNLGVDVGVNWNTEANTDLINNGKYVVERSFDARNYTAVGEVVITKDQSYSFIDQGAITKAPGSSIYYRLKTVANDGSELNNGTTEYSKVAIVNLNDGGVYPNPFSNTVSVNIIMPKAGDVKLNVKDVSGRILVTQTKAASMGSTSVNVDQLGELKPGVYFLTVDAAGTSQVYKIIKN